MRCVLLSAARDMTTAKRDHAARKLLAPVRGLSAIAVFDPETWTRPRLRAFLRTEPAIMKEEAHG